MNRISELRKEKHLHQVGLAVKINVSQYTISAYETERQHPSSDMLIRLADFFNVSIDYLLGRSDIRYTADNFTESKLSALEIKLLNSFRELSKEKQQQALGVLFTLKSQEE